MVATKEQAPEIQTAKTSSAIRLARSVKHADARMQKYRRQRVAFLKQYAGPYYHAWDEFTPYKRSDPMAEPLNTLFSMVEILCPNLVGETIFTDAATEIPQLRPFAERLRLRNDHVAKEIALADSIGDMVLDCIFGAGIAKVGISPVGSPDIDEPLGYLHDAGQPYADPVDLDDYVVERDAKIRERATFEGNRYLVPLDWAYDVGLYDKDMLDRMEPVHEGRSSGEQRATSLSTSHAATQEKPFIPFLEFLDLWVPHNNTIVTLPGQPDRTSGYLREATWKGPERGPYEMLALARLPSNLMPIPYIAIIYDLHILLNELARGIRRRAEAEKNIGLYPLNKERDAEAIRDSQDGQLVGVTVPGEIKEFRFGGVDPRAYEPVQFFQMWQNRIAGNPDLLGGQAARSETLGQDQILMQQASIRINRARQRVQTFVQRIIEKIAWFVWTDPHTSQELTMEVKGMKIPMRWDAGVREGDFLDYNFSIQPYSMTPDSPDMQYQRTMEIVRDVIVPLAPIAASQGTFPNIQELVALLCKKRNIKDSDLWWTQGTPAGVPPTNAARPAAVNISTPRAPAQVAPSKGPAPEGTSKVA